MRNIKLLLEYDGAGYSGWQRQENGPTIQGEVERALQRLLQEEVNVLGAGRTDAGVHARGQVANFRSKTALGVREIKKGLFLSVLKNRPVCSALSNATENTPTPATMIDSDFP